MSYSISRWRSVKRNVQHRRLREKYKQRRGGKGPEKREGIGSRQKFTLPAKWQEEEYERGNKTRLQFSSPARTKYLTQKAIKETLVIRGMKECLHDHVAEESESKDPEFFAYSEGEETKESQMKLRKGKEMERQLFVCL